MQYRGIPGEELARYIYPRGITTPNQASAYHNRNYTCRAQARPGPGHFVLVAAWEERVEENRHRPGSGAHFGAQQPATMSLSARFGQSVLNLVTCCPPWCFHHNPMRCCHTRTFGWAAMPMPSTDKQPSELWGLWGSYAEPCSSQFEADQRDSPPNSSLKITT